MDAATLRLTFNSRNIEAVFGHAYECWVQDRDFWVKRLHPEDRSRALAACTRAIALRRSCTLEYRMLRADGRAVWIRDLVSFATGPEGRDLLRGVMLDITEGREAEEALKRRISPPLETEVAALTQTPLRTGAAETPIPRSAQPPATGGDRDRATRRAAFPGPSSRVN
ncbi:MAG: PAS domain-containing protein [Gammaproteobacteria bacterium]